MFTCMIVSNKPYHLNLDFIFGLASNYSNIFRNFTLRQTSEVKRFLGSLAHEVVVSPLSTLLNMGIAFTL